MHRPAYLTPSPSPWQAAPAPVPPLRRWVARLLRRSASALRRTAWRLLRAVPAGPERVPVTLPRLEYHAEAGAPEGALYVDGEYVGRLDVRRL